MEFLQYLTSGILIGSLYGLIGVAIVIVYKSTEVFNFAVGALLTLSTLICVTLIETFHLPFWLAIIITLILSGLLGISVERGILRPLLSQPLLSLMMATLAVESILYGGMLMIWTAQTTSFPKGLLPGKTIFIGPIFMSHEFVYAFWAAMLCFTLIGLFFFKTQTGLKMRVTAEDHNVAMALGINITRVFALAWILATMVGGVAGIFLGNRMSVQVSITSSMVFKALPAIIFGGLDSIVGAMVGGLIVGILEKMAGGYITPKISEITPYIILLIILIVRPEGLFGKKRIERV